MASDAPSGFVVARQDATRHVQAQIRWMANNTQAIASAARLAVTALPRCFAELSSGPVVILLLINVIY